MTPTRRHKPARRLYPGTHAGRTKLDFLWGHRFRRALRTGAPFPRKTRFRKHTAPPARAGGFLFLINYTFLMRTRRVRIRTVQRSASSASGWMVYSEYHRSGATPSWQHVYGYDAGYFHRTRLAAIRHTVRTERTLRRKPSSFPRVLKMPDIDD